MKLSIRESAILSAALAALAIAENRPALVSLNEINDLAMKIAKERAKDLN